jgi:hypothetical protein
VEIDFDLGRHILGDAVLVVGFDHALINTGLDDVKAVSDVKTAVLVETVPGCAV